MTVHPPIAGYCTRLAPERWIGLGPKLPCGEVAVPAWLLLYSTGNFWMLEASVYGDICHLTSGYAPATTMGQHGLVTIQSLAQVHVDLTRLIRPGKGVMIWCVLLLPNPPLWPDLPSSLPPSLLCSTPPRSHYTPYPIAPLCGVPTGLWPSASALGAPPDSPPMDLQSALVKASLHMQ